MLPRSMLEGDGVMPSRCRSARCVGRELVLDARGDNAMGWARWQEGYPQTCKVLKVREKGGPRDPRASIVFAILRFGLLFPIRLGQPPAYAREPERRGSCWTALQSEGQTFGSRDR